MDLGLKDSTGFGFPEEFLGPPIAGWLTYHCSSCGHEHEIGIPKSDKENTLVGFNCRKCGKPNTGTIPNSLYKK